MDNDLTRDLLSLEGLDRGNNLTRGKRKRTPSVRRASVNEKSKASGLLLL
ncbi:MAG: hypothetical protein OTI34_01655 [Lewinella sp.]|nr:hypothetical protein [Lewinella sp.]